MSRFDIALGRPSTVVQDAPQEQQESAERSLAVSTTHRTIEEMLNAILRHGYQNVIPADNPSIRAIGYSCWNVNSTGEEDAGYFTAPASNYPEFRDQYPLMDVLQSNRTRTQLSFALAGSPHRSFQEFYSHFQRM